MAWCVAAACRVATTSGSWGDILRYARNAARIRSAAAEAAKSIRRVIRARLGTARSARISSSTAALRSAGAAGREIPSRSLLLRFSSSSSSRVQVWQLERWARTRASSAGSSSPRASRGMNRLSAHGSNVRLLRCVLRQQLAQGAARAEEPRLDRADRYPQDARGLFPAPLLHVAEQHYRAVVLRERLQGALDVASDQRHQPGQLRVPEEPRLFIAHSLERLRLFGAVRPGHLAFTVPEAVDEAVAQDAGEPGAHARSGTERLARLEGAQVRLLHQVARVRLAAREPERETVGAVEHGQRLFLVGHAIDVHSATVSPAPLPSKVDLLRLDGPECSRYGDTIRNAVPIPMSDPTIIPGGCLVSRAPSSLIFRITSRNVETADSRPSSATTTTSSTWRSSPSGATGTASRSGRIASCPITSISSPSLRRRTDCGAR